MNAKNPTIHGAMNSNTIATRRNRPVRGRRRRIAGAASRAVRVVATRPLSRSPSSQTYLLVDRVRQILEPGLEVGDLARLPLPLEVREQIGRR